MQIMSGRPMESDPCAILAKKWNANARLGYKHQAVNIFPGISI